METVNIHDAKTHLSRLVERASKGEAFIIARAGKPMVKVVPLDDVRAPDDFDEMGRANIARLFGVDARGG